MDGPGLRGISDVRRTVRVGLSFLSEARTWSRQLVLVSGADWETRKRKPREWMRPDLSSERMPSSWPSGLAEASVMVKPSAVQVSRPGWLERTSR
jgi:hypothetical protein